MFSANSRGICVTAVKCALSCWCVTTMLHLHIVRKHLHTQCKGKVGTTCNISSTDRQLACENPHQFSDYGQSPVVFGVQLSLYEKFSS